MSQRQLNISRPFQFNKPNENHLIISRKKGKWIWPPSLTETEHHSPFNYRLDFYLKHASVVFTKLIKCPFRAPSISCNPASGSRKSISHETYENFLLIPRGSEANHFCKWIKTVTVSSNKPANCATFQLDDFSNESTVKIIIRDVK